ncbi:endoplasmic reticulum-Golgi intermediate compartment protein 3 [Eurytemora carolleeae]|uniref:endoplasmic reticulum-Golgi intermediate compartment protein 3 n=1 Tax=Eurytemora carolleeae TaxID=1294199 RepID=UPI000C77E2DC|nr:endoplasmic reticulum-Golgi intermediate compartment protein 3 [Eurytemora carolleeae]|eukprot:XP_023337737.1 endoplasmic reticulum-Golgi intermediate compartment protein 3-like [Eurytemora affinis]
MSVSVVDVFKRFDAYPKTLEDFRIKTFSGGTITVISAIVMILLFASEIQDYLTPGVEEQLFVDTSRGSKLKINLDIIFPKISCDFLSLDAQDVSGEQHIAIEHNVYKRRLDLEGKPIADPVKHEVGEETKENSTSTELEAQSAEPKCGSCYGAETEDMKCCNTCQEVKQQYLRKSWKFVPSTVEQCRGEMFSETEQRVLTEGCQIYGYLEVNRVGGSFHIAPGKSYSINHVHVHDVQPYSTSDFNVTHTIRHLSFGRNVPGKTDPMDGVVGVAEKGSEMFQYYVKIVPTTFARLDGSTFITNQFSVTKHTKVISAFMGESGMPGIFFNYELAPVMVKYSEKKKSFGHFASGLCAIIGGVFTVSGILDKLVYNSGRILNRKTEIGKTG